MPNYTTFDQVLRDKKLSETAQLTFVKKWLETTYALDYEDNSEFFNELTRVHDHDNQPKHFGRLLLDNAFGTAFVQLIRSPKNQKWRIGISFPDAPDEDPVLLSPVNNDTSDDNVELLQFRELLTAPPSMLQARPQADPDKPYSDLDVYSASGLSDEDARAQNAGRFQPATIPAYLYDPAWLPGVPGALTVDPSLNQNFEEVVARFMNRTA